MTRRNKVLLLAAILIYLYFRGTGDHGLIDPVEGINASIALHMSAGGSYFVPKIGEVLTAGRSMGTWWLEAIALKIFGWSEFAVRFWSALSGLGMILASILCARQNNEEDSERKGWLSAAICAGMTICFVCSQVASYHAIYSCLTSFAMTGIILSRQNKNWLILAHVSCSLAFIAHGLEGIIFTFLAVIAYSVLCEDWDLLKDFFTWPAGIITGVIISGIYIVLICALNPALLYFMILPNHIYSLGGIKGSIIFALISFMPFIGFIIQAIWEVFPREYPAEENSEIFMIIWVLTFALAALISCDVMSLASCAPALSALTARRLDSWLRDKKLILLREAVFLNTLIMLLFFIVMPFFVSSLPVARVSMMSLIPWAILTGLFLFACWYYTRTKQITKWVRNVSAAALLCLMPLSGVFSLTSEIYSVRDIGLKLRDLINGPERVIQYKVNYPSIYFYTLRNSELVNSPVIPAVFDEDFIMKESALNASWNKNERLFLIIPSGIQTNPPLPENIFHILDAQELQLLSNK